MMHVTYRDDGLKTEMNKTHMKWIWMKNGMQCTLWPHGCWI